MTRAALIILTALACSLGMVSPRRDQVAGIGQIAAPVRFSIVGWEARTWFQVGLRSITGAGADRANASQSSDWSAVEDYRRTAEATARGRALVQTAFARHDEPELEVALRRLGDTESQHRRSLPPAQSAITKKVESALREAGVPEPGVSLAGRGGVRGLRILVTPPVSFAFARLPLNLVVARRDRIGIVGSALVDGNVNPATIDALESRVDRTGVSSIVTGIGGLGTFPSMIPDVDPPERVAEIAAHEWVHHFLAFRPLGQAYFAEPEMRDINETVADIVGGEIARLVSAAMVPGRDSLGEANDASNRSRLPSAASVRQGPDFGDEMRAIRWRVEELLDAGSVAQAEEFMADERARLARSGLHIRKINTAYLSFFGAYSGGANRFEQPLREFRSRSPTLGAFLETVGEISSTTDFARIDRLAR